MSDFLPGTTFQSVIPDAAITPSNVQRVLIVSGKLYYDLVKERTARGLDDTIAILRLEELCPFPFSVMKDALLPFLQESKGVKVVWVQEESQNQGAWPHVMPRLQSVLRDIGCAGEVSYVGREPSEVPAVGVGKVHAQEVARLLKDAFEA